MRAWVQPHAREGVGALMFCLSDAALVRHVSTRQMILRTRSVTRQTCALGPRY